MREMDTQWLKHLVSKNIGENIGNVSSPMVAPYLVKDQVKKWGVEVVEDTSQNTMKIRFIYV